VKTTTDGFTALHFTSFKGNPSLADLLLKYGAEITAKNNFGINVVHVAA
jgi:ankyrin repeat protein